MSLEVIACLRNFTTDLGTTVAWKSGIQVFRENSFLSYREMKNGDTQSILPCRRPDGWKVEWLC